MTTYISISPFWIKFALQFTVVITIITLVVSLATNSGLKRRIPIENKKKGGFVMINNKKYPTPYLTEQTQVTYIIQNPFEYLLLRSGEEKECVVGNLLKLTIAILMSVFIKRFDFYDPFQREFFNIAYWVYFFLIITWLLELVATAYTAYWIREYLADVDYRYKTPPSGILVQFVVSTVVIYMYGKAVREREEAALTI